MDFSIQPVLENEKAKLVPLNENDFDKLYEVSSDPAVWANHPNKNRCEREVFKNFFKGAVESGGAFLIYDKNQKSILIGYTFYAVDYWGKSYNHSVKKMMLDYIFQFVEKVIFHVGAENYRSQGAMKKLGARKVREIVVAYYGEPDRNNFEYEITKDEWQNSSAV